MKVCVNCKKNKPFSGYRKHSITKDGYTSRCKSCCSQREKDFYKTKKGIAYRMFKSHRLSSKRRGHNPPSYTKDEFFKWIESSSDFSIAYDNWVNSGFLKQAKPSIDRVNDYEGYSLFNIQVLTWNEHRQKSAKDIFEGKNQKTSKNIFVYDLKTNKQIKYYSMRVASEVTGISYYKLSIICGSNSFYKGKIWSFNPIK